MAKETTVRLTCDPCKSGGRTRDATRTLQFGVYGKVFKIDVCPDCGDAYDQAFLPWTGSAQVLGKFVELPVDDDPFPAPGVFVGQGDQLPDPRVGVVWWNTPAGANTRTRDNFREARRKIWDWGHAQTVGSKKRWPDLSATCQGALPMEVGCAYTDEVWLPMQAESEALTQEPQAEEPQTLMPDIVAPPAARPKRAPRKPAAVKR
jgi:hypothetical protein